MILIFNNDAMFVNSDQERLTTDIPPLSAAFAASIATSPLKNQEFDEDKHVARHTCLILAQSSTKYRCIVWNAHCIPDFQIVGTVCIRYVSWYNTFYIAVNIKKQQ